MTRSALLCVGLCFLLQTTTATVQAGDTAAEEIWESARKGGVYQEPSQGELAVAEQLFTRLLLGDGGEETARTASKLGFKMQKQHFGGKEMILLQEGEGQKSGRGFYLFNLSRRKNHLLMLPHGIRDVSTGIIGLRLFQENNLGFLALNTVPRYSRSDQEITSVQDLGKLERSYFVALSRAFAATYTEANVYQLHGFTSQKRTSRAGGSASMILSGGTSRVRPDLKALQSCLREKFGGNVLLYPVEVQELGGTKNITGKILRESGHSGFIHIEMDSETRELLREEPAYRRAMADCLMEL